MLRIKELRKNKGITQKEAAAICSIPLRSWSDYENGNISPSVEIVQNIAHKLNVSISALFGEEVSGDQPADLSESKSTGDIYLDIIGTQARAIEAMANDSDDDKGKVINELVKLANEGLTASGNEIRGMENPDEVLELVNKISGLDDDIEKLQEGIIDQISS